MRVSLFVPCYIDVFEPQVGIATLELLRRFGIDPTYPLDQTCCGQPMVNAGCHAEAAATEAHFVRTFADCDYIVVPAGSCAHQVRDHMTAVEQTDEVRAVRARTFDLVEFLHDILKVEAFPWAEFPHKVSYHNNCNALRGIGHGSASELREAPFSKPLDLLRKVKGIEIVEKARPDECCGFGGTFSVFEPAVSVKMGQDKVRDHVQCGAEYVVSADSSCMLHQKGCATRLGLPLKFLHIAEVLNGARA
ncbi:(Fe-S)-binding protein [Lamprobacter modestohalophilus]|uniref:(Fe-S)-binding protein n=1 Tax=Lamprobacter modestohalophilus TaxID=1064514 RepID=UPI002ADEEFAC|nr:(Fe-S)-binding protein [Lamprobacter modestohalophilus]MEA1052556.1 (Fe-S)-binding protein [Lamprobacter modestohalophilus]